MKILKLCCFVFCLSEKFLDASDASILLPDRPLLQAVIFRRETVDLHKHREEVEYYLVSRENIANVPLAKTSVIRNSSGVYLDIVIERLFAFGYQDGSVVSFKSLPLGIGLKIVSLPKFRGDECAFQDAEGNKSNFRF